MVKATGFREYDARWLFGKEINLLGIQALGLGLGTYDARASARSRRSSPATISAPIPCRSNRR
jgi:phosphomannomutase